MNRDCIIQLNVGGVLFQTRKSTLCESITFFSGLIESTPGKVEYFVDRDPMYFRYILNWLRGVRHLPNDEDILRELSWEADYFCLQDMATAIAQMPRRYSIPKTLAGIHEQLRQR